jgi:hypothetical protein
MGGPNNPRWRVGFAFGLTSLLLIFVALPGLLGGWVGDDFHMLSSPLYGDWAEVWRVFTRHAGHYLGKPDDLGETWPYRPVTMFTLLFPHALVPQPWLHHVVGLLIHLATGAFLLVALLRQTPPQAHSSSRTVCTVLTALFLLHPVAVETFVFINGRSDLVAGLCLAGLAVVLSRTSPNRPSRWALVAALVFLGSGSKMPFVPAALALWVGLSLRSDDRRDALSDGVPIVAAVASYVVLRAINVPFVGRFGATESIARDFSAFAEVPHLLAKASAAVLAFRAEAMQSLAWQLFGPVSPAEWVGGFVLVAALVALLWKRDWGGAALLGGFAITVAPCVMVTRSIWLGFDRYLYMPSILLVIACTPYVVAAVEARPKLRPLWWGLASILILISALGTRASSLAYVNQTAYERAMAADHPDDPTIVFYLARAAKKSGQIPLARQTLSRIPEPPWPIALVVPTVVLASELSDARVRDMAVAFGLQKQSDDPVVRAYGMRWRYERGELDEALALAQTFGPSDAVCPEVRRQLEFWSRDAKVESQRERLRAAAVGLRCGEN